MNSLCRKFLCYGIVFFFAAKFVFNTPNSSSIVLLDSEQVSLTLDWRSWPTDPLFLSESFKTLSLLAKSINIPESFTLFYVTNREDFVISFTFPLAISEALMWTFKRFNFFCEPASSKGTTLDDSATDTYSVLKSLTMHHSETQITNWFLCCQYIVGLNNTSSGRAVQPASDRGLDLSCSDNSAQILH